jgi:two-component system, OmpR family, sensor kinase
MSFTSGRGSWRERIRQLPGRTPLRIKLITALLALVAIALGVISVASISVFRDTQINQASQQVSGLFEDQASELAHSHHEIPAEVIPLGIYLVAIVPAGSSLPGLASEENLAPTSLPNVPLGDASWFKANGGRLVDVGAITGSDNWRVIAQQVTVQVQNPFTDQISEQVVTLMVGADLGDINGIVGQLTGVDLIVSAIIIVGLALVGVAIVRASLRPLTDIEKTAEAIAAGDLSRRVPDRDPGTEVGRLGRSLNIMLTRIETSFRAQEESEVAARRSEERMRRFVADASHELRTPLTAMRGYAEYYRQRGGVAQPGGAGAAHPAGDPAAASPEARAAAGPDASTGADTAATAASANGNGSLTKADLDRIMQRVEQESARMGVLVEDMLLLARLDQQRPIEHRPVDLLTLALDAVQDARMIAPERSIELTVGSGAAFLVLGDEVRLRQVIGNLMSNALTHTPDGTPVEVRVLAGPRQPVPSVVLEVTDQGPGLRPEQAERVFERFYRADAARTRKAGGTGLGLAIVAALVAAHGGSVALDTAPGQGSTFRITLPLDPEAQTAQADEPPGDNSFITGTTGPAIN